MSERWKPVAEAPGYLVSDMGRVWSTQRSQLVAPNVERGGYPKVGLSTPSGRVTRVVHRLVAEAFVPNDDPANKTQVDHLNMDHSDARAANLEWVTQDENIRRAQGSAQAAPHMTEEQRRVALDKGRTVAHAAAHLGVSTAAVSELRRKEKKR